jgi:hypothetical protein
MAEPQLTKRGLAGRMARIGSHVIRERVNKPKAVTLSDVPRDPSAMTPEWLTQVLCRDVPGARVSSFRVSDASSGSTSRGRLELTYAGAEPGADLPASVWFKASPSLTSRLVTGLTGAAANEGRFYTQIRPGLRLLAPRGYYGDAHPESGRSIVMIEDLGRTRGAHFGGPRERYVTRSMADSMMRELAGYHGAMWESPRFAGDLRWISTSLAWQQNTNAVMAFEKRSLIGVDRAARVSAPGFVDRKHELWPAFMRSLELNVAGPITLLHQDVHAGNWFDADGAMGLYDWHCLARGGWALDVAYAMMSGLTVEDRRAWERELLAYYLEQLAAAGGDAPTFDQAHLQYRQQVFHGLFFWLITIGAGRLQPDMQPVEISEANLERMTHAVMDLDSLGALNQTAPRSQ